MYVFREDNLQLVHIQTNPQKNSLQFHRNEGMADQRNELSHFPISVFSVTIIAIGSELNDCIVLHHARPMLNQQHMIAQP